MARQRRLNLKMNKLYGRQKETELLKRTMERVESGSSEVVLIEGHSGVGKSTLVQRTLAKENCFFCSGTFEQQPGSSPFEAIVGALSSLIEEICEEEDLRDEIADIVGDELSAGEVDALSRFIPDFEELIDDVEADNDSDDDDSVSDPSLTDHKDSLTKIMIAIRDFLRIVTEQAPNPIVLWLDDLQWADAASLELIDCIANDEEQQYFILVATYRGNEVEVGHPVHRWKKQAEDLTKQKFTNPTTTLTLKGLNIVDVNKLLADLTNLDEGATFPLATLVMTRTNGNMFFVIQLLEHLQNEDLLVYDASNFKWTWDLDKVRGTALSDHVVDLVASRIQRHPDHVQRVLQLAACLGFKIDPNVLEIVKSAIPGVDDIEEHLNFCVEERMMERLSDGRVKFFHDRIHQATMSLLPDGVELTKLHLRIGVLLWGHIQSLSKAGQKVEDKLLFLCAEHMSNGSDQISDVIMKLRLVQLNNMVGVKATQLSAFATAAEYFERGLELLDSIGHKWETHHTLCMSMQVAFAEVLYYVGQNDASLYAVKEVLTHNPTPTIRKRASLTRLHILKAECHLKQFVDLSLTFLDELGQHLPRDPSAYQVRSEHQKVMKKVQALSDDEILNLPRTSSVVLQVLTSMIIPLDSLGMKNLTHIAILHAVSLSLTRGISTHSAEAFALLGALTIGDGQDLAEGYRFGELALALAKRLDPTSANARVFHWVYMCTKPWQLVPVAQCVDKMFEGHVAAMKQGDPFTAFLTTNAYFELSFCSALDLGPLVRDIAKFSGQMLEYGQKLCFLKMLPIWQCILNLSGESLDPLNMNQGEAINRRYEFGDDSRICEHECRSYAMQIAVYMGERELASELSAKLQGVDVGIMKAHCMYPVRVFFFALIAIANARATGKRKYKHEASKYILLMRHWVQKKAANLVHKLMILEAEHETLESKDGDLIRAKYDLAISTAAKSGFLHDAALAAQLAGKAISVLVDVMHFSDSYIQKSHMLWKSWGAFAVAAKLKLDYADIFPRDASFRAEGRGNFLSRERFDRRVSLDHQRRLSEEL